MWLGNAGAALAALSFVGAASSNGTFRQQLLLPLGVFLGGIVVMGVGEMIAIWQSRTRIDRMVRSSSTLDFSLADLKSSTEEIGLTLSDWRTRMAFLSAVLFIAGCGIGFYQLLHIEPHTATPPEIVSPASLWDQISTWMCPITIDRR